MNTWSFLSFIGSFHVRRHFLFCVVLSMSSSFCVSWSPLDSNISCDVRSYCTNTIINVDAWVRNKNKCIFLLKCCNIWNNCNLWRCCSTSITQFSFFYHWALVKEYSNDIYIPDLNFEIMTHKPFQYSVDIRKIIKVIPHISTEQFIRLYWYRFYGLCWRKCALVTVKTNISTPRE